MATVGVAALLGMLPVACESEDGPQIEGDEQTSKKLIEMSRHGEGGRLADFTEFDWDTVYTYFEGASEKEIEREVGGDLKMNDHYYSAGCLMVFVREGEVVRALSLPEVFYWDGDNSFGSDVKLVPGRPGKSSGLNLEEPHENDRGRGSRT